MRGGPVLFWLCRVEIITEHGHDVQMFINAQQGQIIVITVVVAGATGQHGQVDWGQQGVTRPGSPEAWSLGSGLPERE